MLTGFFARYAVEIIAAVILLPVIAFNFALFFERTRLQRPDA